jgi:hypothetical protein
MMPFVHWQAPILAKSPISLPIFWSKIIQKVITSVPYSNANPSSVRLHKRNIQMDT